MARMTISGYKRAGKFTEKRLPQRKRPLEEKSRETALVVEDVNTCRLIAQGMLRSLGMDAFGVPTSEAAFDLVMRGNYYNFILVDFYMTTTITGPETVRQMRVMGVTAKILGVCLHNTEENRQIFLEAGADACIEKPLTPESLGNVLQEMRNM